MLVLVIMFELIILAETTFLIIKRHRPMRSGTRKIYVDSSALIDGRILNIAKTGFLDGDLVIPRCVLRELQLLADSKDKERRNRARAALSTVSELERVLETNVEIVDDGEEEPEKVDDRLITLAKAHRGVILTTDYNLIKVAEATKIETLNINDLALAVRTEFLPGERTKLRITDKGSNRGQGVGHLPDGTMVVVEKAGNKIGKEIEVELVRFHQTSSGKILFARKTRK